MHDPRPAPLQAVIFDKDGVLVDFQRTWTPAIKAAAADFASGDEARAMALLRKVGFDPQTDSFLPGSIWAAGTNADLIDAWAGSESPARRAALVARMAAHCEATTPVPLVPPERMRESLRALKDLGLKLALISNDTTASVNNTARAFGLEGLFDFTCGFDAVKTPKPAAEPVLRFAAACGIAPERMAVIGDNEHDALMARAAGCAHFIAVLSGTGSRDHLSPFTSHIARDMLQAAALAKSLAGAANGTPWTDRESASGL